MSVGASLHAGKHSVLSQCVWAVLGILGVPYGPHYGAANFLTEVPYLVLVLLSPRCLAHPLALAPSWPVSSHTLQLGSSSCLVSHHILYLGPCVRRLG